MINELKKEVTKKKTFISIVDTIQSNSDDYDKTKLIEVLTSILTKSQRESIINYLDNSGHNELMRACEYEGLIEYDSNNFEWKVFC